MIREDLRREVMLEGTSEENEISNHVTQPKHLGCSKKQGPYA
jgi:hypothetical protein